MHEHLIRANGQSYATMRHMPLAQVRTPLPFWVSSTNSPSYLLPVGQCMNTDSGSALSPKGVTWLVPSAQVRAPVPFRRPSFQLPSYLLPEMSAGTSMQGLRSTPTESCDLYHQPRLERLCHSVCPRSNCHRTCLLQGSVRGH